MTSHSHQRPEHHHRGGEARPITITVRPAVAAFALALEGKLQENDFKPDWLGKPSAYHMLRLRQETEELADEVVLTANPMKRTPHQRKMVRLECADVAAFAMFLCHKRGDLDKFIGALELRTEEGQ